MIKCWCVYNQRCSCGKWLKAYVMVPSGFGVHVIRSLRSRLRARQKSSIGDSFLATTTVASPLDFSYWRLYDYVQSGAPLWWLKSIVVQPMAVLFQPTIHSRKQYVEIGQVARCSTIFINPPTTMDGGMFDYVCTKCARRLNFFSFSNQWLMGRRYPQVNSERSVHYGEIYIEIDNLICAR